MKRSFLWILCLQLLITAVFCGNVFSQSSAISYQGSLKSGGNVANGPFDFVFKLFDAGTNGSQVGVSLTNVNVMVSNGLFTTTMDFGTNSFTNASRWLDIAVRTNGTTNAFTLLVPRQLISPAPYALYALNGVPGPIGLPGSTGPAGTNGPAGTTGQNATTVYGTGTTTAGGAETLVAGLTQTVSVPTNSVVFVSTDGGVRTTSVGTGGFSDVEVYVKIDGAASSNGAYAYVTALNNATKTTGSSRWAISFAATLTPGNHMISLYTILAGGSSATVSGAAGFTDQGELTVVILKK